MNNYSVHAEYNEHGLIVQASVHLPDGVTDLGRVAQIVRMLFDAGQVAVNTDDPNETLVIRPAAPVSAPPPAPAPAYLRTGVDPLDTRIPVKDLWATKQQQ